MDLKKKKKIKTPNHGACFYDQVKTPIDLKKKNQNTKHGTCFYYQVKTPINLKKKKIKTPNMALVFMIKSKHQSI